MSKPDRFTWVIYSGIASAISFSVLAFAMLALAKYFTPQSVHMSWGESPIVLFLTLPCGFVFGGWVGYDLAPKTKPERIEALKEFLFYFIVMGAWNLVLSRIWNKPEAKDHFWAAVAWDIGPLLLAVGLLKVLRCGKRKA